MLGTYKGGDEIIENKKVTVAMHREICELLNKTYEAKNRDYGNSYSKSFEEFGPVMCAIRLDDKLNRFKTLIKGQVTPQVDESIEDTLLDLANYAIMAVMEFKARGEE